MAKQLTDFIEVRDNSTDESLQALANLINSAKPEGEKIDWRALRRDFTGKEWQPKLKIVETDEFPYHAYAVHSDGRAEREGRYAKRSDAENNAMDYASRLNSE